MEISKNDTKMLKGVAILLMLLLHLFARKEIDGLYEASPMINGIPLIYYISLLGDACRQIYLFITGYAFYHMANRLTLTSNINRIFKLFVNYWIVLLLFVPLGILMGKTETFPLNEFLPNFFVLSNSYNGAWWFMQTYVILVLVSPYLLKVVNKYNPIILFFIAGTIYFVSYVQQFKHVIDFSDHEIALFIIRTIALLGTSQFSFVIGAIFAKEKIYTKIYQRFNSLKYKNIIGFSLIAILIFIHSVIESAIISPLNGIPLVCIFTLMNKSVFVQKTFAYIGDHSTNIWLTHMFFYMTIFPELTFAPRYPILIFIWLVILCLGSSYVIKAINKQVNTLLGKIDRMVYNKKVESMVEKSVQ